MVLFCLGDHLTFFRIDEYGQYLVPFSWRNFLCRPVPLQHLPKIASVARSGPIKARKWVTSTDIFLKVHWKPLRSKQTIPEQLSERWNACLSLYRQGKGNKEYSQTTVWSWAAKQARIRNWLKEIVTIFRDQEIHVIRRDKRKNWCLDSCSYFCIVQSAGLRT